MKAPLPRLLAITPGDGRDLYPWVDALGGAGLQGLLIRELHMEREALEALVTHAERSLECVHVHSACAPGPPLGHRAHLSWNAFAQEGGSPHPGGFGVSTHTEEEVKAALEAGADYTFLSPVHRPTSKPHDDRPPLGMDMFLRIAKGRPVYALGGITAPVWADLKGKSAFGAAVLGDLFGCDSPQASAERLSAYSAAVSTWEALDSCITVTPTSKSRSS